MAEQHTPAEARQERWRLILGGGEADGVGCALSGDVEAMDRCLQALYDSDMGGPSGTPSRGPKGGLGSSAPNVSRWLGDIRKYFPSSVVKVMQKDAFDRLGLQSMLLEPELLSSVEPDVSLVATLISLKNVIPARTKDTARQVVNKVCQELMRKLEQPVREAVTGSINRAAINRRPRHKEINWDRTIRANLKNYLPEKKTIVPEHLVGYGRKRSSLRDIILCVDQSGSMATSVVYSGIFAAVMASIPAVSTKLVVFDTAVVDLTDELADDPVDILFGVQLGGGTDINSAVGYCRGLITRPEDSIFILVSDLCEGGDKEQMLRRVAELVTSGVTVVALLALDDAGAPWCNHDVAAAFAGMGIPTFACTPDKFPDLMAAAIGRRDIAQWAALNDITTSRKDE